MLPSTWVTLLNNVCVCVSPSPLQYQFNQRLCSMATAALPPEEEAADTAAGLSLGDGGSLADRKLPGALRDAGV